MNERGKAVTNPLTLPRKAMTECRAAYDYIQVEDKKGAKLLLAQAKLNIEDAIKALEVCRICGSHPYGCSDCRI